MSTENNLKTLYENSIKILSDLIAFKTISGEDNNQLIDYCDEILKKFGATSFKTFDKDTIDKYHKRYTITKKIKKLRKRIEKWARKNGYENIGKQKEVKDKLTGDYVYMYTDWEMVDDHHGLMINDWDWLPSKKQYKEYNVLWKNYSNVQNLV